MTITYGNIETELQSTVYNILKNDTTVSSLAKVLDGIPLELTKGRGAYVLVHCPEITSKRMTNNGKFEVIGTILIECVTASMKESIVRTIVAAVREALRTNESVTRNSHAYLFNIEGTNFSKTREGSVNYFNVDIEVSYRMVKL